MVCKTFMSRMLWMKRDSSRQTTEEIYLIIIRSLTVFYVALRVNLQLCSFWLQEFCWCSCSCRFRFPSWSGKPSISGEPIVKRRQPDCWRTVAPQCKRPRRLQKKRNWFFEPQIGKGSSINGVCLIIMSTSPLPSSCFYHYSIITVITKSLIPPTSNTVTSFIDDPKEVVRV